MRDCEEFYRLRDLRTNEYVGSQPFARMPVHVVVDRKSCLLPAGQVALLALANLLVRAHRRITFEISEPSANLLVPNPFALETLGETLLATVTRIDPCGEFQIVEAPPGSVVSVGLGDELTEQLDWYLGAHGAIANLAKSPRSFAETPGTLRGAALASCLGASAVFRSMLGLPSVPRDLSCWDYAEGIEASLGPETIERLDVGRVLMVGAGAVAAAVVYWLTTFGIGGDWTIVDKDVVTLDNTNRGLLFTAIDAGWPQGDPELKSKLVSGFIRGSRYDPRWYHESKMVEETYDVVLGLANEHEVRHYIASRNNTVTLHATTGINWLSQVHRHIIGLDDCIWCRAGKTSQPKFKCSTSEVELVEGKTTDAALPFLSAASGLMLVTALQRLQRRELAGADRNDWRWDFGSTHRMMSSSFRRCRQDCARIIPAVARQRINAGGKWNHLDVGDSSR